MENKLAVKLRKFNRICPLRGYKEDSIKVGAHVVVLTNRGEESGVIVSFPKCTPPECMDVRLKKVIRYATEDDLKIINALGSKEQEILDLTAKKVKEYELPLRIVGVECLFDPKKINIYYKLINEGKNVDLKDFRKDISTIFKAEVNFRAVTPRDEAKFVGGLGPCGRCLCCMCWLEKPKHITVKMVKNQGLQISPTKTSGICGRLMCCFAYEDDSDKKEGKREQNDK